MSCLYNLISLYLRLINKETCASHAGVKQHVDSGHAHVCLQYNNTEGAARLSESMIMN